MSLLALETWCTQSDVALLTATLSALSGLVRKELMDVWEADRVLQSAAWYVEHAGMKSREIHQRHMTAIERVRPLLDVIMVEFDVGKHFGETPLVSKQHWDEFMDGLPKFGDGFNADQA